MRPSRAPIRRANDFFHSIRPNSTSATSRRATPITAARTNEDVSCPVAASSPSEITGSASFMKMFQMPVTST